MVELILVYVYDAEYYTFDEAFAIAEERDKEAAENLLWSILDEQ